MEQFTVDNLKVLTFPLKPRVALRLDKRVATILLQTFGGKEKVNLIDFTNIPIESLLANLADALSNLNEDDFISLSIELLSTSQIERNNKAIQIVDGDSFDRAFEGCKIITIYKILLKIMEINKFTPFELAEKAGLLGIFGNLTGKTPSINEDLSFPPSS